MDLTTATIFAKSFRPSLAPFFAQNPQHTFRTGDYRRGKTEKCGGERAEWREEERRGFHTLPSLQSRARFRTIRFAKQLWLASVA
jgi:hypothetical protein